MIAARCWWPVLDLDLDDARARVKALGQIPRIAAENHWIEWGEPTSWRYEEGNYEGEPTLFLICDLDVVATPAGLEPTEPTEPTPPTEAASMWASRRGAPILDEIARRSA